MLSAPSKICVLSHPLVAEWWESNLLGVNGRGQRPRPSPIARNVLERNPISSLAFDQYLLLVQCYAQARECRFAKRESHQLVFPSEGSRTFPMKYCPDQYFIGASSRFSSPPFPFRFQSARLQNKQLSRFFFFPSSCQQLRVASNRYLVALNVLVASGSYIRNYYSLLSILFPA